MDNTLKTGRTLRGKPKSGRFWKNEKKKFSSMKADKPLKTSWKKKLQLRQEIKIIKSHEKQLKDAKAEAQKQLKERREENKRRREENERKAEIVQPIKNLAKLKRMTKKQLKKIQKR